MAPSHIVVRLDWLITSSGIEQADAIRWLNAIENQLANQRWRFRWCRYGFRHRYQYWFHW